MRFSDDGVAPSSRSRAGGDPTPSAGARRQPAARGRSRRANTRRRSPVFA